jgi:type II restriction enzyme
MAKVISKSGVTRRVYWINEIEKLSGNFTNDYDKLEKELIAEVKKDGIVALLDHLRLSGDIPEQYSHDSSEEKLYSKYTDALLCETFKFLGFRSVVLTERGDAADVDTFAKGYSFVGDAKAFRLSRTAKNQKDFKVQAMDGWKRGKPFAMVVCPIYQLPTRSSQIYEQASTRNVCIFTYSHLAVLVSYRALAGPQAVEDLLLKIFNSVKNLAPSKDAQDYWNAVNNTMLSFDKNIEGFWKTEKIAAIESIEIAKELALDYLKYELDMLSNLSHEEALKELIRMYKIDSKIEVINGVTENEILEMRIS